MVLMTTSDLPLERIARGKVRDVYAVDGDRLLLSIDTYTAVNGVMSAGDPFDVDAWEDGFLEFRGAIARSTFRALHQMARALLTGRMVRLCAPDGRQEIYDGIPGATVRQRPYRRA